MPAAVSIVSSFLPHGYCYLWQPGLVYLHVASDAIIAVAYYSIPISLLYLFRKRSETPFKWMLAMFGAFIVLCGTTHVISIISIWSPIYWIDGAVKAATAGVSILTAILLVPALPRLLRMPSPILDGLTGLANRLALEEKLTQALQRAQRKSGTCVALLFIDLDGFKVVNDSLGHARGDELLITVARKLRRCVRPNDVVARFGGDEFMVMLDDVDGPAAAKQTARRIILAIEEPVTIGARVTEISASVGIVVSNGKDDAVQLIKDADRAMYFAKQKRRGSFQFVDDCPPEPLPVS